MAKRTITDETTGAQFTFQVPDDATDAQAWAFFRQMYDAPPTAQGSPAEVRLAIGAARGPEDRLAALRKFYPSATPMGDDNFWYFDDDGQKRVHNPEGLDWGDVPGAAPEIAEALGATVGGIGGALTGAVGGPLGSAGGALTGAGLGGSIARDLAERGTRWATGVGDSRGLAEQATDMTTDALYNAAGEGVGRLAADAGVSLVKRALASPGAAQRAGDLRALGVDTRGAAGEIGDTALSRKLAAGLHGLPSSANTMGVARDKTVDTFANSVLRGTQGITPEAGNEALALGGEQAARSANQRIGKGYGELASAAQDVSMTANDLAQTRALRDRYRARYDEGPGMSPVVKPALDEMDRMLSGPFGEGASIPYGRAMEQKTFLFDRAHPKVPMAEQMDSQSRKLKEVYDSVRVDMRNKLAKDAPDVLDLLDAHNEATIAFRATPGPTGRTNEEFLNTLGKKETNQLRVWAMAGSKNGAARLEQLRALMPDESWDTFSKSVLADWGYSPTIGRFSTAKFVRQWNDATDVSKRILFGDDYERLSNLARVGESLKETDQYVNRSNTGMVNAINAILGGGPVVAGLSGALTPGAAAAATLPIVGPWATAKGITAPGFVGWATTPGAGQVTQGAGGLLGRLPIQVERQPQAAGPLIPY